MKRTKIAAVLLTGVLLAGCRNGTLEETVGITTAQYGTEETVPAVTDAGETSEADVDRDTEGAEDAGEEDVGTSGETEKKYYEIQVKAEQPDRERIAAAVFGDEAYEIEDVYGTAQYSVGDDRAIDFYGYDFVYYRVPQYSAYMALLADSYGALFYQDMRLECMFPDESLPQGGRDEAEEICDGILEGIGYAYTEKNIFTLDTAYTGQLGLPYVPSQPGRQEDAVWEEDEGAYLLIYRNGDLVDVEEELAYAGPGTVCTMIYSPRYGLCGIDMEPGYRETGRTEVEIIPVEEAGELTRQLFYVNGVPYNLVEVTGYELVYCEQFYARDEQEGTSLVIPCWKVSFREDRQAGSIWEDEGLVARAEASTDGYLLLDARVGGDVYTFCPVLE